MFYAMIAGLYLVAGAFVGLGVYALALGFEDDVDPADFITCAVAGLFWPVTLIVAAVAILIGFVVRLIAITR